MLIRARRPADMAACVAILAEVHRTSGYPAHWPADPHRWLTPSRLLTAWVAEDDGAVVGHVALTTATPDVADPWSALSGRPSGDAIEVSRLFVAVAARGRALGRQLLDTASAEARARGAHPVLGVLTHNRPAIALYRGAGWVHLSETDLTMPDGSVLPMYCFAAP